MPFAAIWPQVFVIFCKKGAAPFPRNTMMRNQTLSDLDFEALRQQATPLQAEGFDRGVWLLDDGRIMKLFRFKKLLTSDSLFPYNRRFVKNSKMLVAAGIPTVGDARCFKLPSRKCGGVFYHPLEGDTLRALGMDGQLDDSLCAEIGRFTAMVHHKGILFRSIHPGNIVRGKDGRLGFIDIADVSRQWWPLQAWQRQRNFRHMFRSSCENSYFTEVHRKTLIEAYFDACPSKLASDSQFQAAVLDAALGKR